MIEIRWEDPLPPTLKTLGCETTHSGTDRPVGMGSFKFRVWARWPEDVEP